MSKHNYKKRLKYVFLAFTCATAFSLSGLAAACGNDDKDKDKDKTTTKEDTQLLKNGNFEFFTIPEKKEDGNEPEYLIKTPENWSHGGSSSYTMSGIISTSKTAWDKMSAETLADDLDYNNKLDSSSSDYLKEYIDYNGMKSTDILYKDQFKALEKTDDLPDDEKTEDKLKERKERIENPGTHYNVTEKDGKFYTDGGNGQEVFVNDKGEYFLEYDEDKDEYKQPISNVLMLHNYATTHNGIAQNYSSIEISLPANTAAEISVWVKTSYLKFNQGKQVTQDRGANITVTQTVGNSTLDDFTISCINTEKLLGDDKVIEDKYNGWVEYTVFINACDFAESKIKLELGLGEDSHKTEGYAFFDDVSVTKLVSLDDSEKYATADLENTTSNLSSDGVAKTYKADSYKRNDKPRDPRYSRNFEYCIDLASEHSEDGNTYDYVKFNDRKYDIRTGFTVDGDNYVSSRDKNFATNIKSDKDYGDCRLPFKTSLSTASDLVYYVTTSSLPLSQGDYADKLNEALKSAADLPKNSPAYTDNMLVMLSAYGAAYTTSFDLTVEANGYQIVSFWVKTSDMNGSTAATVKITQTDNDENSSNFTLDTTGNVTDIGDEDDEKDIYDGWVQCFFFVKNELDTQTKYTVDFSFGNTTIKGTDVHSYKNGWVALANMQYLNVDEKIFSYAGSGDNTASLTISEEAKKTANAFDEAYANQSHEIENDMVIPSTYKGVNGSSSAVVNNKHVSIPFDEFNNNADDNGNKFTGLINQEYFENYRGNVWYNSLLDNFNASGLTAIEAWNRIFGEKSVQPLVINNRTRTSYVEIKGATEDTFKNYFVRDEENGGFKRVSELDDPKFDEEETYYDKKSVMNYGYIGENKEVSADSYATVSVRVKVSANAIAYVYLVDTSAGKNTLSFNAPSYSFYYDVDGNVLKGEPKTNATVSEQRENVLYSLRDDGLYEDKDGNLYANLWNYKKSYYNEDMTYYDANGNAYSIDDLVDGETYYADKNKTEADHYLVTGEGAKIYEFKDGAYHYIVEGKTQSEKVNPFDTKYARYDFSQVSEDYVVEIAGKDHLNALTNEPEWVTVTFVLHAGSEAKSYRLELWSGKREETETAGNAENGTVIFDYSYTTVSDDSMKSDYEKTIIDEYLDKLSAVDGALDGIDTTGKNIAFYEKLAKENNVTIGTEYKAHYNTFSLYDSANYVPFNKTVASDGATGYDYSVSDQQEALAYLQIKEGNDYTIFADYSTVDKSVTLNNPSNGDDNDTDDTDNSSDGSVWLLASSIILVIALLFAILAIFLKDALKKARRNKVTSKNNYDHRRTNRYKRKLHLKTEEFVEVEPEKEPVETEDKVAEDDPTDIDKSETEESVDDTSDDDNSDKE